jgi:hypothetical protein
MQIAVCGGTTNVNTIDVKAGAVGHYYGELDTTVKTILHRLG